MQKKAKHKIVIIGCGNVAWHLAKHFYQLKKYDLFVYNHKQNSALNEFKTKLKCTVFNGLDYIITDADFYFICITDKFISNAAKKINSKNPDSIIIHTSGSLSIDELGNSLNSAVFYPLQTFSKKDIVNWKEIPIVVEANNSSSKNKIIKLAKEFSDHVIDLKYKERLKLHLAAVLVNNFTNSLFVAANNLISQKNKNNNLQLLLPLIKQTVLKVEKLDPLDAQTGPAKRKDEVVMKKHLKLLSNDDDLKKIYKQLSNLIIKQQQKKHA